MDIIDRLQRLMHAESAAVSPATTETIEAMREAQSEIERLRAQSARLREAAYQIYWSANWTADREVDHDELWDELRDAGDLERSERRAALDELTAESERLGLYGANEQQERD